MDNSSYFDMGVPGGGRGSVNDFVLNSLLRSRIDCGFESNGAQYDEDVNVYLVHLLSDLVTGPGLGSPDELRDIDVFHRVKDSRDPRFKGEVYRASADRLLLSTGIFVDSPFIAREGRRVFEGAAQTRIGRGKTYYHFASMFHGQARSGSAALARILDRLSIDFERYVEVLFHMRGEYFNLYERLSEDVVLALQSPSTGPGDEPDSRTEVERLRDDFLDAYWTWNHAPTLAHRALLLEAAQALRARDPSFVFDVPEA
jgi:hypothetical protein